MRPFKPTGTGLGLAVVSRIVEQHHGFLSVDSSADAGTCFSMYLPAT
jgi:signal transduction histidine kinase